MPLIKTGVIGHPIAHSKSPLIHNYWIERHGLSGTYEAIDIDPEELKNGINQLIETGFNGFNVTIPHKRSVMELCDTLDETARAVGAVNTVTIREKKLHGTNTDVFGFIENIRQSAPDFDFTKGSACIIGAGGAARAVLYGLLKENVPEIRITNRTQEKSEGLKDMVNANLKVIPWQEREGALSGASLLVNTTSLGMTGKPSLELDIAALPKDALVCDIVYAPLYTNLLKQAQQQGNQIVTGIGMLLHQARPAFEEWFGVRPEVTPELEALALK